MKEIMDAGLILGICTTSNERAAHAIAYGMLKDIRFDFVLAGDVVSKKSPTPKFTTWRSQRRGCSPMNAW